MVKPNTIGANGQRFDRTPEGIAMAMSSYGGKGALYDENAFMRRGVDFTSIYYPLQKLIRTLMKLYWIWSVYRKMQLALIHFLILVIVLVLLLVILQKQ